MAIPYSTTAVELRDEIKKANEDKKNSNEEHSAGIIDGREQQGVGCIERVNCACPRDGDTIRSQKLVV